MTFTLLFPLWAIILSTLAYLWPGYFVQLKSAIVPLLMVIMFSMGMTLTIDDFRRVLRQPKLITFGVLLQYLVMPLAALFVSRLFNLSPALTTGMVLVGASSGGTASNVICFLARGNVALSVTLTLVSTLVAVVALPGLTWLYLGHMVKVQPWEMLKTVAMIALVPVLLGAVINTFLSAITTRVQKIFPIISVVAIVLIIAIIVALNKLTIAQMGMTILLAVILHNAVGLLLGYWLPYFAGYDKVTCRTLSIEVGMQNSGLSVSLAKDFFSLTAALPGALFSIWHNLSGSLLASIWNRKH